MLKPVGQGATLSSYDTLISEVLNQQGSVNLLKIKKEMIALKQKKMETKSVNTDSKLAQKNTKVNKEYLLHLSEISQ